MTEELRPPVEYGGKHGHHWIQTGCGATVAEWDADDQWWSLIGEDQPVTASDMILVRGYRCLGPAEWRDPYVAANWESVVADKDGEIDRLRTERDYERARFAQLPPALPYPRAHDLGVPPINDQVRAALAPSPIAKMVAAALPPEPEPATHAAPLPKGAMR